MGDGVDQMVISANADRVMVVSKGSPSTSANHISDYQRVREANIAKNKELIRELGLNDLWGIGTDKATGKKGKNLKGGTEKKDADETGTR